MYSLNLEQTKLVSDGIPVVEKTDANSRPGLVPKNLVIHAIQASSMQNAVNEFLSSARSLHLLIERNGQNVVQMVEFNRIAIHANELDPNSLGIGLIYPGHLTERPGFYYSKDRFDPREVLRAPSANDVKTLRWYPFYPQEQLDTLLEITRLLDQAFGLDRILMRQEIHNQDLISGPALPINRLRQLLQGEGSRSELLEGTTGPVTLRLQPFGGDLAVLDEDLPEGTPLAVVNELEDSVLVEVMTAVGERRWTVGWMPSFQVTARPFQPKVNEAHMLVTADNRRVKFIAAHEKNFSPATLDPQYVIIHFTTGVNIQSTIHTFLNPENGVSAHLVVGRTGRVVQMVPFDKVAFHAGLSTWEGERSLNRLAIGIEVDNAGYLRQRRHGFRSENSSIIPAKQVQSDHHWKNDVVLPWQTFSPVQIQVVLEIVKALKAKYPTIREILGHDMVNLVNRFDPGPFYPLGELREAVLGAAQPPMVAFVTTQECPIYEYQSDAPPNPQHPVIGELPKNATVRVKEVYDDWTLVIVKESRSTTFMGKTGWIRSNSIEPVDGKARTKTTQKLFAFIPAAEVRLPPLLLKIGALPAGTHVRIQFPVGEDWALVAPVLEMHKNEADRFILRIPPEKVPKVFLQGWVESKFLEKA